MESMGDIMAVLKKGGFQNTTPKLLFVLSPGYAHLPDGVNFVYAIIALFSEEKFDVIIAAPNREMEERKLSHFGQN